MNDIKLFLIINNLIKNIIKFNFIIEVDRID